MLGKIRSFFASAQTKEIQTGLSLEDIFAAAPTAAGKPSRPALVPTSACAITALSDTVGVLPAKIYRKLGDGDKEPADHPANVLVHDRASDWQSACDLRREVMKDALTHQNGGFAWVNKVDGRPVEMHRLSPGSVCTEIDKASAEPSYIVTTETGALRRYGWDQIIHIRGLGGVAPAFIGREATAFLDLLAEHAATLFANGARPGVTMIPQRKLSEKEIANFIKLVQAQVGGSNRGKSLVPPEPVTLDDGGAQTVVDSNLEGLWRLQTMLLSQAFRVPPHILMNYAELKWQTSEAAGREWLTCLLPWLEQWSFMYSRTLFTREERDDFTIEFIVEELLKASYKDRVEGYLKLRSANAINGAQIRKWEDLPPSDDPLVQSFANPNTSSPKSPREGEGDNE